MLEPELLVDLDDRQPPRRSPRCPFAAAPGRSARPLLRPRSRRTRHRSARPAHRRSAGNRPGSTPASPSRARRIPDPALSQRWKVCRTSSRQLRARAATTRCAGPALPSCASRSSGVVVGSGSSPTGAGSVSGCSTTSPQVLADDRPELDDHLRVAQLLRVELRPPASPGPAGRRCPRPRPLWPPEVLEQPVDAGDERLVFLRSAATGIDAPPCG